MTLDLERKSIDAIVEDADTDKPHGGFTAVLSTPSLDRDGDILTRDEWVTPLPERLPLDIDHNMTVEGTVGSFRPYFDDEGRLMMDATFASTPKAQEVRTLIKEGHIGSVSVAFMTDRSKKDGTPRRELLNAGVVAIPSNRDAIILSSKAAANDCECWDGYERVPGAKPCAPGSCRKSDAADKTVEAEAVTIKANGDMALIQAIHDASCHMGAMCCETATDDEMAEMDDSGVTNKPKSVGSLNLPISVGITLDQFKVALNEITTSFKVSETSGDSEPVAADEPQGNSPADLPVDTAEEAATDSVPVDSPVDTAGDAAESEVVLSSEKRARNLAMAIFSQEVLSD